MACLSFIGWPNDMLMHMSFCLPMNDMTMVMNKCYVLSINQCLYLPKAELNTKNSTRWQLRCYLVEFLVFNSITHAGKIVIRPTRKTVYTAMFLSSILGYLLRGPAKPGRAACFHYTIEPQFCCLFVSLFVCPHK